MHPVFTEALAHERITELRRAPVARPSRRRLRARAGWLLVGAGLRLALPAEQRPVLRPRLAGRA